MFQFRAFPSYTYLIQCTITRYCRVWFPNSEISGSMRMCRSPELIAACHVLLRLLMPRHSLYALSRLTFIWSWFSQNHAGYKKKFFLANCITHLFPQFRFLRVSSLLPYFITFCYFVQFSTTMLSNALTVDKYCKSSFTVFITC